MMTTHMMDEHLQRKPQKVLYKSFTTFATTLVLTLKAVIFVTENMLQNILLANCFSYLTLRS